MTKRHMNATVLLLIALVVAEAARVYVWEVGGGIYETAVAIYFLGVLCGAVIVVGLWSVWRLP